MAIFRQISELKRTTYYESIHYGELGVRTIDGARNMCNPISEIK